MLFTANFNNSVTVYCFYSQSFLSHKYGYRPFPRVIPADEFDLLTDEVTEEEEKLIDKYRSLSCFEELTCIHL